MTATHTGYKDPNNLKFETITVLGMPHAPNSVSVTHFGPGETSEIVELKNTSIHHDAAKEVNTQYRHISALITNSLHLQFKSYLFSFF